MQYDVFLRMKAAALRYMDSYIAQDAEEALNFSLKKEHTLRVVQYIRELAESIALPEQLQRTAQCSALLHDIGRFPQYRQFRSFDDRKSGNHAVSGIKIIQQEQLLDSVEPDEKRQILRAIYFHNVFQIPAAAQNLDRTMIALLRDADKLDIFTIIADAYSTDGPVNPVIDFELPETGSCSPFYVEGLLNRQLCSYTHIRSAEDVRLMRLSWIFDLNFTYSFKQVRASGFINRILKHLPGDSRTEMLRQSLESFLASQSEGLMEPTNFIS